MKRKIIKQGHNTLTVTLPSKWAQKFEVKAGDEVDLIEQGKDLKISTEKSGENGERAIIDISNLKISMLWRLVSSAYRAGYDEIKITFENKSFRDVYTAFTYNTVSIIKDDREQLSPLEAIQALTNRFVGFEITEQKSDYCIIKDLGNTSSREFNNTLRRIFLLLQTMSEAVIADAKEGIKDELKGVHIIDTNLDRFEDYCLRVLNKEGYSDFKKTSTMYSIIFILELVGDEYKKLGLHMLKMKSISKNTLSLIEHMDKLLKEFYELYYNFSNEKIGKIYDLDQEATKIHAKIYPTSSRDEIELLHHLKKIGRFILSLLELRVDMAY